MDSHSHSKISLMWTLRLWYYRTASAKWLRVQTETTCFHFGSTAPHVYVHVYITTVSCMMQLQWNYTGRKLIRSLDSFPSTPLPSVLIFVGEWQGESPGTRLYIHLKSRWSLDIVSVLMFYANVLRYQAVYEVFFGKETIIINACKTEHLVCCYKCERRWECEAVNV